ncbi:MAG: glutamate--tRNA ligase [Dehalococcoidia bacterium]|nr:glutamate--tRNA ligase [Dehalococcoidia bacterium]
MTTPVRVRFAPSPTGIPHVGNIRTAMFNWLYARHTGGQFIVRIEDTDQERKVEGALEAILESLLWLGITWDEGPTEDAKGNKGPNGPYFQSQRLPRYREAAEKLLASGHAYLCHCSTKRLEQVRFEMQIAKRPPMYDRRCRDKGYGWADKPFPDASPVPVVRFKTPLSGQTRVQDRLRGEVVNENSTLDDFVLLKSDGFPTYHLANVVDDHLMSISHVLRAEEWLPSTPRHVLLYEGFGWAPPVFVHLPLILGADRSKLSKRHGATSLLEYRDKGYLPEAMVNYLALLGWSLDDKTEIISRDELIKNFSLERIGKTGAIFNQDKLMWVNGVYIRNLASDDMARRAMPFLEKGLPAGVRRPLEQDFARRVMPLAQERAKLLSDVPSLLGFFFAEDLDFDPTQLVQKGMTSASTLTALEAARQRVASLAIFNEISMENELRTLAQESSLTTGQLFGVLRVATTGEKAAPPLFQTMAALGRERTLKRISRAIERLRQQGPRDG